MFVLWKVGEHAVVGKETLKFGSVFGSLPEYWRKSMIIGETNTDLKRLTGRLKLRFLTEIGRLHWNQGEEVAHFAWFGEPWGPNLVSDIFLIY
jgi:hypothetical protein